MARKTHSSILQFSERFISRMRVRRSPKGVDVIAYDVRHGKWSVADGSLAEAVREFAKEYGLIDDNVCSVLPRHDMTTRILDLPSHSSAEIESMVRLGAEEYVPYPVHELVIDECVIQKLNDGSARVLAVFAHKDVVESHVAILHQAGIEPDHIYVSTACLASAAQLARVEEQRYAIVHLGGSGIEVAVMQNGRLVYGRGIATASDWRDAGAADSTEIEELAAEVRASLAAYRRESEDGESVERVYLSSDYADCNSVAQALADITGYECGPARFASGLFEHGTVPAPGIPLIAAGAALAAQERAQLAISLVPQSLLLSRQSSILRRHLYAGGGLFAAVIIAAFGVFGVAYYQRASYMRELQARIAAVQPTAESVESKRAQLVRLQQHLDRRGSALELLAKLSDIIPRTGVTITRFNFVHNESLTIQGRADSPGLAYELTDALRSAGRSDVPQFARAKSGASKEEREQDQPVYQFDIIVPLGESESDVKTDEAAAP